MTAGFLVAILVAKQSANEDRSVLTHCMYNAACIHVFKGGGKRSRNGEEGGGRDNVQLKTDREQEEGWSQSWEKRGRHGIEIVKLILQHYWSSISVLTPKHATLLATQ